MSTCIKQNNKELIIGNFDTETGIWYISRDKNKHYFNKTNSWGLDEKMFKFLYTHQDLKSVVIKDYKTNEKWKISAEDINKYKEYLHFKREGTDYRIQIFIPEKYWEKY